MMRRIMFIINPVAGNGRGAELIPKIKIAMEQAQLDYGLKISSREGRVEVLADEAVKEGFTEIVAVGGDGTITEVMNGIFEKSVTMGIIPSGTGNDFIRSINIPSDSNAAIQSIVKGHTRDLDVGLVNGHPFLNVVSMGIDGNIIRDFEKIKTWIKGPSAYLVSTIKSIMMFKPFKVRIRINEETFNRDIVLIAIGNGRYFGGGMEITPKAKLDDGLLDVCIVHAIARHRLLKFFPKVFTGSHLLVKDVEYRKCDSIEIENISGIIHVNSDGNLIDQNKAAISIAKKRQKFIVEVDKDSGF